MRALNRIAQVPLFRSELGTRWRHSKEGRPIIPSLMRKSVKREWSTPLAERLSQAITVTGPIPVASYMRMCMTGDDAGYYNGALGTSRDQFGHKGDFVTSPMISQVFGELVSLFFVAEWVSQGQPKKSLELYEFGPGRGQLMDDILRVMRKFPVFNYLEAINLLEASPELMQTQWKLFGDPDCLPTQDPKTGRFESRLRLRPSIKITWSRTREHLPKCSPESFPMILAHEFFDALPIHVFETVNAPVDIPPTVMRGPISTSSTPLAQPPAIPPSNEKTKLDWRELLVRPAFPNSTHETLRTHPLEKDGPVPDFQLVVSQSHTRHSRILPAFIQQGSIPPPTKLGQTIEISLESDAYAADIATRIGGTLEYRKSRPAGAALVIDYGVVDGIPSKSIRGIQNHKRVSPFSQAGLVDISADVNFTALVDATLNSSEGVEIHGPVFQSDFLKAMGLEARMEQLRRKMDVAEFRVVKESVKRLVDSNTDGMGRLYYFLAIIPENGGRRRPVGFGGDVA